MMASTLESLESQSSHKNELLALKESQLQKSMKLCDTMLTFALQVSQSFFQCKALPRSDPGGFYHETHPLRYSPIPQIVIGVNHTEIMRDLEAFKSHLLHQLVLTFDHCRLEMDYTNCAEMACTEIRAARLSGECGPFGVWGQKQAELELRNEGDGSGGTLKSKPMFMGLQSGKATSGVGLRCIRRRAAMKTNLFEACYEKGGMGRKAWNAVNEAWSKCFRDIEPYRDRVDAW